MRFLLLTMMLILPQTGGARVEGVVVHGQTGRPLPSAQIQIAGLRMTTDSQGRFAFASVPFGRHTLLADKDGFMRGRPDGRKLAGNGGIDVVVPSSRPMEPLTIRLFPAAVVTGRVYDSNGQPVRNVVVTPYRPTYDDTGEVALKPVPVNRTQFVTPRETMQSLAIGPDYRDDSAHNLTSNIIRPRTNDLGEFRLFNLDPGRYAIYLDPATNDALPVFYPGVADAKDAALIEVKSGEEFRLNNVTLLSGNDAALRVRIYNQSGETNVLKFVEVRRKGSRELVRWQSGSSDAVLSLGRLTPGAYEVEANVQASRGLFMAAGHADVVMAGSDVEIEVTVPPGPKFVGRILQPPSKPVAGVRVSLSSDDVLRNIPFTMTSGADGTFSMPAIPAGTFRLNILSGIPRDLCVTSILQGDRNVIKDGFQVQAQDVELNIRLGESQASLKGNTKTPGAMVVLAPNDRKRSDLFIAMAADQNGEFDMPCVQPGVYRAFAWSELDGAAYRNADFMQKYETRGVTVNIAKGGNVMLDVLDVLAESDR